MSADYPAPLPDDTRALQSCIRDLVTLLALPAVSIGRDPRGVVQVLVDVMLTVLRLDVAYVRLNAHGDQPLMEVVRVDGWPEARDRASEIGRALAPCLDAILAPVPVRHPLAESRLLALSLPFDLEGQTGAFVGASVRPDYPLLTEKLLLRVGVNQAAIALRSARLQAERAQLLADAEQHILQLRALARASVAINASNTVPSVLRAITEQARDLIGAHQAATSMIVGADWSEAVTAVSLSDKYAAYRGYDQKSDGAGLHALVCQRNQPLRMTEDELLEHPASRRLGEESARHPPLRGWLGAPLVTRDGRNLGLVQLSDKYAADFTEQDTALLVQLAQLGSVAIENAQLNAATQAARAQAEAANRAKDEFLATVSHELRTPLNSILGWTRMLREHVLSEEKSARALEIVERNARVQAQLIEDVLDVSRIITGNLRLSIGPVEVLRVIEAAVETVRPSVDARGVQLELRLDPAAGTIMADGDRLQQIVWNLLSNAIKFTPKGGRVQLDVQREDAELEIVVTDTGQGIAPEFLPYVFDRFRQADGSSTRSYGGLGLGLAIVKHLVELHGGSIEARSDGKGKGASFTVSMPLAPARSTPAPQPLQASGPLAPSAALEGLPRLTGLRILVVDDEPDARELLRSVLETCEATVITAASVAEAFASLERYRPDLLVSDIGMPGEDGYGLIGRIRALPADAGGATPAVALTAYARSEDRTRVLVAGFDGYIAKPVEPQELVAALAKVMSRSGKA